MASSASGSLALTRETFSLSTAHSNAQRSRANAYVPPPAADDVTLAFHPPPSTAAAAPARAPSIEAALPPQQSLRERYSSQGGSPAHAALAALSADGGTPKYSEGSAQTLTSVQSVNGGIVDLLASSFTPGVHFRGECAPIPPSPAPAVHSYAFEGNHHTQTRAHQAP